LNGPAFALESASALSDKDAADERAIEYGCPAHYKLSVEDGSSTPFHRFEVFVDQDGVGHLQSRPVNDPKNVRPKRATASPAGLIDDWDARISFLDEKRGWTKLTFLDAGHFWKDSPGRREPEFLTFNVANSHHEEENIFHIDLLFNDTGLLSAYRVRGIGIKAPQWTGPSGKIGRPPKDAQSSLHDPDIGGYEHVGPVYVLSDPKGKPRFNLYVDSESTGQLHSYSPDASLAGAWFKRTAVSTLLDDGYTQTSPMSFPQALEFWGKPRGHDKRFLTFDAHTDSAGEPEVFHLDLEFNEGLGLTGYRIRGMCINNPKWVWAFKRGAGETGTGK